MSQDLSQSKIMKMLEWSYEKAINGVTGLDSAGELAESYLKNVEPEVDQVNSL